MATKKRGLGRGLDALLADVDHKSGSISDSLQYFPLDKIQPGKYQPRVAMSQESLDELADSIRAQGVVQPIVVRPTEDGHYEIIAGERRWRACKLAGLDTIPALVRDVPDRNAIAMALIENICSLCGRPSLIFYCFPVKGSVAHTHFSSCPNHLILYIKTVKRYTFRPCGYT